MQLIPNKKYNIIYADPPWSFGSRGARSGRFGELDYSCMSTQQICGLQIEAYKNIGNESELLSVSEIAADNSALFLWTTGAHLVSGEATSVVESWGFRPVRVDSVWAKKTKNGKPHAVTGPWGMNDAEFLVMGTRGKMCSNQHGKRNFNTIVEVKYTGTHSEKPLEFRRRICQRFAGFENRLELFSRQHTPGWVSWGNEI